MPNKTKKKPESYKKYWKSKKAYENYKYNVSEPTKKEIRRMEKGKMFGFRRTKNGTENKYKKKKKNKK